MISRQEASDVKSGKLSTSKVLHKYTFTAKTSSLDQAKDIAGSHDDTDSDKAGMRVSLEVVFACGEGCLSLSIGDLPQSRPCLFHAWQGHVYRSAQVIIEGVESRDRLRFQKSPCLKLGSLTNRSRSWMYL
jgi:hypothetical protein